MSIRFYHRDKVFAQTPLTQERDKDHYFEVGNNLILDGLKKGNNLGEQIIIYLAVVDRLNKQKIYNIQKDDQQIFIACILALWRLGVYDPDTPEDPLWISPKYKKSKKLKKLRS
tara:strand:- start:69 stop:410 length:342 start_codon:yes stop_codon:yes gene_type:complete